MLFRSKDEMRRDDRLYVYNPHLFSRYAQRMNIDKTGLDLIVHFFKNNLYYFFYEEKSKDGIYDFRISTKEGVLFGVCDYPMVQLRTFVSNEMLFEDQSEYLTDTEEIIEFGKNNCFELQNPEYIR